MAKSLNLTRALHLFKTGVTAVASQEDCSSFRQGRAFTGLGAGLHTKSDHGLHSSHSITVQYFHLISFLISQISPRSFRLIPSSSLFLDSILSLVYTPMFMPVPPRLYLKPSTVNASNFKSFQNCFSSSRSFASPCKLSKQLVYFYIKARWYCCWDYMESVDQPRRTDTLTMCISQSMVRTYLLLCVIFHLPQEP